MISWPEAFVCVVAIAGATVVFIARMEMRSRK